MSTGDKFREYALSAVRAKLAYLAPDAVKDLWAKSQVSDKNAEYYLFKSVKKPPVFLSNRETNAQAYAWVQSNVLHIVFRGTKETSDVLVDLDLLRSPLYPDSNIFIHDGFLRQFRSLESHIFDIIVANFRHVDVIHFSGHSLGGALATLASAYFGNFYDQKYKIICHSIGSPRVGNLYFAILAKERVHEMIRITAEKDPVPLLPMSFLYSHINESICINDACIVTHLKKDVSWFLRLLYFPFQISCKKPVHFHSCDVYIERLLKLAALDVHVF